MKISRKLVLSLMVFFAVALVASHVSAEEFFTQSKDKIEINGGNEMGKLTEANRKIENAVVSGYKTIENGFVSGYKAIEDGVVGTYKMIEKKFVDTFLTSSSGREEAGE